MPYNGILADWVQEEIKQGMINNIELAGETLEIEQMFSVIKGTNAKLGKDGNQWYYIVNELPNPDCIVGFGDTPRKALEAFYESWEGRGDERS